MFHSVVQKVTLAQFVCETRCISKVKSWDRGQSAIPSTLRPNICHVFTGS